MPLVRRPGWIEHQNTLDDQREIWGHSSAMSANEHHGTEPLDASRLAARREALTHITTLIAALLRKLGKHREVAIRACALASQVEEIARQARLLAFRPGRTPAQELAELVDAIGAMAADAAEVVKEMERGAVLGREIAMGLDGPLAELVTFARYPERLTDTKALRAVLTPLASLLTNASSQRAGAEASGEALLKLGRSAVSIAERSERLSVGGGDLKDEVLGLSRDLTAFAAEAVQVAAALNEHAEAAERVLSAMTAEVGNMGHPTRPATDAGLDDKIAYLLRSKEVPHTRQAVDWGGGRGGA